MHVLSPKERYDFIQVIYIIKEYYTKVEYFSKNILFTTIYLM
jgi:hypothetical protein